MIGAESLPRLGQGFYFEELSVGAKYRTFRRIITETDLVNFIATTGMLEELFIDPDHVGPIGKRPVPAALTYSIVEGFLMQSMIQGTGMALLEVSTKIEAPVHVNDTIWATVEVTALRPTSKGDRAIVSCNVCIYNQRQERVMTYDVKRLLAGREIESLSAKP